MAQLVFLVNNSTDEDRKTLLQMLDILFPGRSELVLEIPEDRRIVSATVLNDGRWVHVDSPCLSLDHNI